MSEVVENRRIDELGRVVIPMVLRNKYQINEGDILEVVDTDDGILIRVPEKNTEK